MSVPPNRANLRARISSPRQRRPAGDRGQERGRSVAGRHVEPIVVEEVTFRPHMPQRFTLDTHTLARGFLVVAEVSTLLNLYNRTPLLSIAGNCAKHFLLCRLLQSCRGMDLKYERLFFLLTLLTSLGVEYICPDMYYPKLMKTAHEI